MVNNEGIPHQANYLLDEVDTISMDCKSNHGPNSVASMLHTSLLGMASTSVNATCILITVLAKTRTER